VKDKPVPQPEPIVRQPYDLLSRPTSAIFWWGLPLVAGWAADLSPAPPAAKAAVWALALSWMGVGCVINARRCHRLHCYISGPVLFLGAFGAALTGLGVAPLGPPTLSYVINVTFALALLSFLTEPVWGRFRSR
jgi:hypothetical protein